jgi:hypothetical protein
MDEWPEVQSLTAVATLTFHKRIEAACKVIKCNKATFIRLACRLLVQEIEMKGSDELIPEQVATEIPYCRSAWDLDKNL